MRGFDAQSEEQRDWEEDDDNVADDREDGKTVEGRADWETSADHAKVPCAFDLFNSRIVLALGVTDAHEGVCLLSYRRAVED